MVRISSPIANTSASAKGGLRRARVALAAGTLLAFGIAMLWTGRHAQAAPAADAKDTARSDVAQMTPHDVGSRYGQALGAVEICPETQTTRKVPALNAIYAGEDLQTFKTQATKIYDAWTHLKQCASVDDPGECRVVVEESCAAAVIEIGPSGTIFPGLIEGAPN